MDEDIDLSQICVLEKEKEGDEKCAANKNLGLRIEVLRSMLEMSKTDFANFLHASRSTLDKIVNEGELSQDMAYKMFYATTKAMEGPYNSPRMREFASLLRNDIEQEIILSERNKRIENMISIK